MSVYLVAVTFVLPALSLLPVFVSNSYQVLHSSMIPAILSQHVEERLVLNIEQGYDIKCSVLVCPSHLGYSHSKLILGQNLKKTIMFWVCRPTVMGENLLVFNHNRGGVVV